MEKYLALQGTALDDFVMFIEGIAVVNKVSFTKRPSIDRVQRIAGPGLQGYILALLWS
jgi:hypothetical protein